MTAITSLRHAVLSRDWFDVVAGVGHAGRPGGQGLKRPSWNRAVECMTYSRG